MLSLQISLAETAPSRSVHLLLVHRTRPQKESSQRRPDSEWTARIDFTGGLIPDLPSQFVSEGKVADILFVAGTNVDEGEPTAGYGCAPCSSY